jgi:hypothetical protein
MILLVCESRKLRDLQASPYIAFFPSLKTRETHETCTDIFARSESHFPQNSCEKNCETRLAVNPSCISGEEKNSVLHGRRKES